MNIQSIIELMKEQDKFRSLERALDLPKGSIKSEYERRLILAGIPLKEATRVHDRLLEIATKTPFSYETVIDIHSRVKDTDIVERVLDIASQRIIDPHAIVNLMFKKPEKN